MKFTINMKKDIKMNKTILAGMTINARDDNYSVVDWAVNETDLTLSNPEYVRCLLYIMYGTSNPTTYDFLANFHKNLVDYDKLYKDSALLYVKDLVGCGRSIIHINEITSSTSMSIIIETPYRDKYDVKLDVSKEYKEYGGCIRYRLGYKDKYYTTMFTDFNIQSVTAKEYALCKEFSYSIDELPNEPIVLRNRNKTKEVEILTKRDNETWEDFIYDYCGCSQFDIAIDATLKIDRNEAPRYYNLFLSPKNYQDLMNENCSRDIFGGKILQEYRNINFVEHDHKTGASYIKNKEVDVTIHINRNYQE